MSDPNNLVIGDLKYEGQIDNVCNIEDIQGLVKHLAKHLKFYVPASITNVLVGNKQPADSDRYKVWFKQDNSSNFEGIYIYAVGAWRKIYPVETPGNRQVFWISGDSRSIPEGFELIEEGTAGISSSDIESIKALYRSSVDSDYFTYYAVVYKGF